MFILTEKKRGGVFALPNTRNNKKTVQCFVQRDDAERYISLMEANDAPQKLEIMEIDDEIVAFNCDSYGYRYTVINPHDFVIPPL